MKWHPAFIKAMTENPMSKDEVCKFAAGYVPSPLHCGCPECCPALAKAERRLKTISAVEKVKNLKKAFSENDIPWPRKPIKTSTLLATAKAIYQAHYDFGDGSEPPSFERQPPLTKDAYGRMAKAAAEAINRDYPLRTTSGSKT